MPSRKRPPSGRPRTPRGPGFKPSDFIASHPVFRFDEFLAAHRESGASRHTTAALLRYHVKTGRLVNLRRGLYAQRGPVDPWVLGSRLAADAVIAYDGALSFHGLGPLGHSISLLTRERVGHFVENEVVYRAIRDPVALKHRGGQLESVERGGQRLEVTSKERTLVDLLDRLDLAHGTRELWDSFQQALPFSAEAMAAHARALKSQVVAGRIGFFLEQMGAPPSVLAALEKLAPASPTYFEPGARSGGERYFSRWKLVVSKKLRAHVESGQPVSWWTRDRPDPDD